MHWPPEPRQRLFLLRSRARPGGDAGGVQVGYELWSVDRELHSLARHQGAERIFPEPISCFARARDRRYRNSCAARRPVRVLAGDARRAEPQSSA